MDKEQLLFLTRNYNSLTPEEARELISLKSLFPYSQLLHNLAARGARDNSFQDSQQELQVTAIYSTDRSVLKSIMAAPRGKRPQIPTETAASVAEAPAPSVHHSDIDLTGDDLLAEIAHDLDRLKELKHQFEVSFHDVEFNETPIKSTKGSASVKPVADVQEPSSEELIKKIQSTKKKFKPEGPKQKEQLEIIDQFIKIQPSISPVKAKAQMPAPATDLTETSSAFSDHIISETLVDILLKQGKKDKAVEVLKKLIWKFPQKKAYFAAQIDELKK